MYPLLLTACNLHSTIKQEMLKLNIRHLWYLYQLNIVTSLVHSSVHFDQKSPCDLAKVNC